MTRALVLASVLAPLLLALAVPPAARAQTSRASPASPDARAILALEERWAAAVVKRDGATFQRLLAPGFVYTENDSLMGRDDVLRSITSGSDTVAGARNEGMEVHAFGPALAVVTGWLVMRGRGADGPFDRRYRFTDTWAKQGGRWRIVAAHDYLAPAGGR
ncbi:MAG: nuclear transport factor 2 family protein [Gemmatimonadaceae bacterium]